MDTSDRLLWMAARTRDKRLSWLLLFQWAGMLDSAYLAMDEELRRLRAD